MRCRSRMSCAGMRRPGRRRSPTRRPASARTSSALRAATLERARRSRRHHRPWGSHRRSRRRRRSHRPRRNDRLASCNRARLTRHTRLSGVSTRSRRRTPSPGIRRIRVHKSMFLRIKRNRRIPVHRNNSPAATARKYRSRNPRRRHGCCDRIAANRFPRRRLHHFPALRITRRNIPRNCSAAYGKNSPRQIHRLLASRIQRMHRHQSQ
jgi:hypothetical protein